MFTESCWWNCEESYRDGRPVLWKVCTGRCTTLLKIDLSVLYLYLLFSGFCFAVCIFVDTVFIACRAGSTLCPKIKGDTELIPVTVKTLPIKKKFTCTFCRKFAMKWLLKIPLHFALVATLRYDNVFGTRNCHVYEVSETVCCGLGGQEILVDCCMAGVQQQAARECG